MRLTALSSTTSTGISGGAAAGAASGSGSGASAATPRSIVNQNVLPRPGSPCAPIVPPMSSTSSRQMLSPRPVPPWVRVVDESACENGSNSRSACSASMPIPVSVTSKRTQRPRALGSPSVTRTVISPSEVNLTALETRFVSTCWSRKRSPTTCSRARRSTNARRSRPLPRAFSASSSTASSTASDSENSASSSSSLPASIFDRSRMSLMIVSSCSPEVCTIDA